MVRPARRRLSFWLVLAGTAAMVISCGTAPASPRPADPFPPRPAPIDVTRLDVCAALPAGEAQRLDFMPGIGGTATVDGVPSPACTWISYDPDIYGYGAQVIPLDAALAAEEPGSRVVTVEGYGAVRSAPTTNNSPRRPAFCQIAVDVADGQTLRFQLNTTDPKTGGDPAMIEVACREAERFGALYLRALRS